MPRTVGSVNGPHARNKPRLYNRLSEQERRDLLSAHRKGATVAELAERQGVSVGTMRACVRELHGLQKGEMTPVADTSKTNQIVKMLADPKKIERAIAVAKESGATPLQAANALMNIVDQLAMSGVEALRERYDPRYEGLEDLGLGYATSGDPASADGVNIKGSRWMRNAIAQDDWSPKEVTQILMMAIKNRMDMAPFVHPKVGNVEPVKKDQQLENLTPTERRAKLKELGSKLGLKITDDD